MTTQAADAGTTVSAGRGGFYLRRLHALSGVVPVGVFLVVHLWTNASALQGREAFTHAVGEIQRVPALGLVELFGIIVPLAFHAVYGVVIALRSSPNALRFGYGRNWMFVLQRVTGLVALAFIAVHLAEFRVPKLLGTLPWEGFYDRLAAHLAGPGTFALYVVGVTACVVHFAHGLWLAGNTWGFTGSERAMRRAAFTWAVLGVLLWALGVNTLLHFFYRCGGVLALPGARREAVCRDADVTP